MSARRRAPATARRRAPVTTRAGIAGIAAASILVPGLGCSDGEPLPAVEGPTVSGPSVVGTEMRFTPDRVAVKAGTIPVTLTNKGTVLHDLRIDEQPFVIEAGPGETAQGTITLTPGRYEIFCSLPGHKEAGMKGVLEVR